MARTARSTLDRAVSFSSALTGAPLLHQADILQDRTGRLDVLLELRREGIAGEISVGPALVGQRLLPGGRVHHLLDIGSDRRFLLGTDAGRGGDHAPVLDRDIDTRL